MIAAPAPYDFARWGAIGAASRRRRRHRCRTCKRLFVALTMAWDCSGACRVRWWRRQTR